jgi:glycosyltransferase involved in cell wall biosynthesis
MNTPKVSIVTVVFNAADLLEKTLISVFKQDFRDYEYIIVDGNSTDGTKEVIKKYEDKISFWISEKDDGLYDAMNKGLTLAKGEYIWFLHAGDRIPETNTLSKIFEKCTQADVIYGDTLIVNPDDGRQRAWYKKTPQKCLRADDFINGMLVCHQSILIKKECAELYNLKFHLAGDIDWCIRSFKNVHNSCYSGVVHCLFLGGGISSKKKRASLLQRFDILRLHFGLFRTVLQHFKFSFQYFTK